MNAKLDLGCGPYRREGYIGLDMKEIKNIDIIGDAHNLPIRDNVLYEIISSKVFEHLKNPYQCASEYYRVLRRNIGVLILGIPNIHNLGRFLRWAVRGRITVGEHIYCWGLPEITGLVESNGFKRIEYYLDTYDRYHKISFLGRLIRRFNKRIIDKNLNVVFVRSE